MAQRAGSARIVRDLVAVMRGRVPMKRKLKKRLDELDAWLEDVTPQA